MSPNGTGGLVAQTEEPQGAATEQEVVDAATILIPAIPPVRTGAAIRGRSEGAPKKALEMLAAIEQGEQSGPSGPTGHSGGQRMLRLANGLEDQGEQLGPSGPTGHSRDMVQRLQLPQLPQRMPNAGEQQERQPGDRLFSDDQQRQLEWMQSQAPHLYGARPATVEPRSNPPKLSQEELRLEAERLHVQWQLEKEKAEMLSYMQSLHEENMKLKVQLAKERDNKYATPESRKDWPGSSSKTRDEDLRAGATSGAPERRDDMKECLKVYGMPDKARSATPPQRTEGGASAGQKTEAGEGG